MVTAAQQDTDADVISFELGGIFGADDVEINEIDENELLDKIFSDLVHSVTDGKSENFQKEKPVCKLADDSMPQQKRFPV